MAGPHRADRAPEEMDGMGGDGMGWDRGRGGKGHQDEITVANASFSRLSVRQHPECRDNPLAGPSHSGVVVPAGKRLGPLQFGSRFSGVAFLSGDGLGSFAGGVQCCGLGKTLSWLAGSDGTEGRKRGVYFVTTN